jgi:hypothetical protein
MPLVSFLVVVRLLIVDLQFDLDHGRGALARGFLFCIFQRHGRLFAAFWLKNISNAKRGKP